MEADLPQMHTDGVKVKQLEDRVDDLQSELNVKSAEIEKLKNENKMLVNKCSQLKEKEGIKEKKQSSSSLNYDTEVCMYMIIVHAYK